MSRGMPYSLRLAMATAVRDHKTANAIIVECFEDITHELLGLAAEYDRSDLPFVIATMKIVAQGLSSTLTKDGRELVDKLTSNTACITIDVEEMRRQAAEGKDHGGDEKC